MASSLTQRLAAPFDPREVKWKAQLVKGNRALAVAYVDARVVEDRLDEVLGVAGWQDDYEVLEGGSVMCRLRLKMDSEWITKMDVGSESEQPDEGDRRKAAFSDALKRAAVKFGVGRYLYRLPQQWVDYDPVKKQLLRTPALPGGKRPATPAGGEPAVPAAPAAKAPPADGAELDRRLREKDAELARLGLCKPGDLLAHVRTAGAVAGLPAELHRWGAKAVPLAAQAVKEFEAKRRAVRSAVPAPPRGKLRGAVELQIRELEWDDRQVGEFLDHWGAQSLDRLTPEQLAELHHELGEVLAERQAQRAG